MATKREELEDPNSTWNKIKDLNEPIFILRGQDIHAIGVVMSWIARAKPVGAKLEEAWSLVGKMIDWPAKKRPD